MEEAASRSKLDMYQALKVRIHRNLLDRLDLSNIDLIETDTFQSEIRHIVEALVAEEKVPQVLHSFWISLCNV